MGVKKLWPVLEPVLHPVNLPELRNLRLAVDLSIWISEGLSAFSQMKGKAALLQKRIIFQRIMRMLQWGIRPVFVLEGSPPALKADTLAKRRQTHGYASCMPDASGDNKGVYGAYGRLVEELKEMFAALNVPYIVSEGEAEATCAQLNSVGLVDGCITDDSDAFLFGAKVVYKNFTADPHKVDQMKRCCYDDVEKRLGLTRDRLVALALLSGCDYTDGLKGVGPETVLSFFKEVGPDDDVLRRLKLWKEDENLDRIATYKSLPKPSHCTKCCHNGTKKSHDKDGCDLCNTEDSCREKSIPCTCEYHQKIGMYKYHAAEIGMRSKALEVEGFPDKDVIDAFLKPNVSVPRESFVWPYPDIEVLKKFVRKKFNWSVEETLDNVLSLYTGLDMVKSSCAKEPCKSVPIKIFKKRQKNFTTVFEVQWRFVDGINDDIEHLATLEDANLFNDCYPEVVCAYDLMVEKKRNRSKGKKRKPDDESQIKINQIFKVRKKLFVTPNKASRASSLNGSSHDMDPAEGSSSQMDAEFSQETLASALPQTPPRKSPRLTPKKRMRYSPSPSRLSQGPKDFGAKGLLPKRLHFSRDSTPDRAKDTQTPDKTGQKARQDWNSARPTLKSATCTSSSALERDMDVDNPSSDPSGTPVGQSTGLLVRKEAWLPTLSPMHSKLTENGDDIPSSVSGQDDAFKEEYQKVKESMSVIDLTDSDSKPTTSLYGSAKAKTPKTASVTKSVKKSGGKSTSKKLKTPGSSQMRINNFVKRRLLRS